MRAAAVSGIHRSNSLLPKVHHLNTEKPTALLINHVSGPPAQYGSNPIFTTPDTRILLPAMTPPPHQFRGASYDDEVPQNSLNHSWPSVVVVTGQNAAHLFKLYPRRPEGASSDRNAIPGAAGPGTSSSGGRVTTELAKL